MPQSHTSMRNTPSRWTKRRTFWCLVSSGIIAVVILIWVRAGLQHRAYAQRTHCVGNLNHISLAKAQCQGDLNIPDGDRIPEGALNKVLTEDLGKSFSQYRCPNGGAYLVGNAGITPQCTYTNVCYTYSPDWSNLRLERHAWRHVLE